MTKEEALEIAHEIFEKWCIRKGFFGEYGAPGTFNYEDSLLLFDEIANALISVSKGEKMSAVTTNETGLRSLIGQTVTLFCQIYIYTGKLVEVYEDCVLLENPSIVFETGPFDDNKWRDAQALPNQMHVMKYAIECFGVVK